MKILGGTNKGNSHFKCTNHKRRKIDLKREGYQAWQKNKKKQKKKREKSV